MIYQTPRSWWDKFKFWLNIHLPDTLKLRIEYNLVEMDHNG
jgi:hypothetical protein